MQWNYTFSQLIVLYTKTWTLFRSLFYSNLFIGGIFNNRFFFKRCFVKIDREKSYLTSLSSKTHRELMCGRWIFTPNHNKAAVNWGFSGDYGWMGGWNRWKKGTRLLPCGHTPSPRTTRAIPFFTQSNKATRKKRSKHETGCYCVGSAGHGPYSTIGIAKTKKRRRRKNKKRPSNGIVSPQIRGEENREVKFRGTNVAKVVIRNIHQMEAALAASMNWIKGMIILFLFLFVFYFHCLFFF